jgi:hypothetical protein
MVLLVAGFAWLGVQLWALLCVLELELGDVAWLVELGLGVVSLCAQAPRLKNSRAGNVKESSRFIVVSPGLELSICYRDSMVRRVSLVYPVCKLGKLG